MSDESVPVEYDPPPLIFSVSLKTIEDVKAEYERIYNEYAKQNIATVRVRSMGYLLSSMLALFKLEVDWDMLRRIESCEAMLKNGDGPRFRR